MWRRCCLPPCARCLDQDHPDLEVIAVDDGSTDGTVDILERHAAQFPDRIRVITQTNQGASTARNAGMQACSGEWLQFLDADDVLLTDKISGQIPFTTDADVVIGDYEQIMPNGLVQQVYALYDRPWMALDPTPHGHHQCQPVAAQCHGRGRGGWDQDQHSSQDYELLFRMLSGGARIAWDRRLAHPGAETGQGSDQPHRCAAELVALRDPAACHEGTPARHGCQGLRGRDRRAGPVHLHGAAHPGDLRPRGGRAELKRHIGRDFVPEVGKAITERYVASV